MAQHASSLREAKNWQVKGFAKSALRNGDTYMAANYLQEWLRREPSNTKVAYLLGQCYEQNRDYRNAIKVYDSIYQSLPRQNIYALYKLSEMRKIQGNYPDALSGFTTASKQLKKLKTNGVRKLDVNNHIEGCKMALAWADTIVAKEVNRLNNSINYFHKETRALILSDKQIVYGSTALDTFVLADKYGINRPTTKIYEATLDSSEIWERGTLVGAPYQSLDGFDSSLGVFSLDRQRYFSTQCAPNLRGKMICKLYVSELTANGWSPPKPLSKKINRRNYSSSQPAIGTCYDKGLEVIYFTSNRPGGAGGSDIWFTVYNKTNQSYSSAQNAGVYINTHRNELSPNYDLTSHRLYFSSDGWPSIGGFDIFSAKGELVTWDKPVNVGYPLNSSYDDLDYCQSESGNAGFIVSNRPDPAMRLPQTCCDDLFSFTESLPQRVMITGRLSSLASTPTLEKLLGKGTVSIDEGIDLKTLANKIIDIYIVRDTLSMLFLKQTITDEDGNFTVWVDKGEDYKIAVKDTNLLVSSFDFSTDGLDSIKSTEVKLAIAPLPIRPTQNITIDKIYYEFGSSDLTEHAKVILDSTLVLVMKRYPLIRVEIESHTDDVGGERANLKLSERRAAGVVSYLQSKGIAINRLTYKGYGFSRPIAPNKNEDGTDNPEGRSKNRRTEFRILGVLAE